MSMFQAASSDVKRILKSNLVCGVGFDFGGRRPSITCRNINILLLLYIASS
jgi:hypothetical protein